MILSLAIGCFVVDGWSFWLSVLFLIFFIVQLIFYGFIYRKAYAVDTVTIAEQHPVSVIVAARNDAPGLKKLLPELLRQQYGCFEIIVADDRSVDDTREVVTTFIGKSDKIRYLKVEPCVDEIPGKKLALSKAIRQAKYELLLFTDADCVPSSLNWIQLMASACNPNTDLVLGYGAYVAEKTWLNSLIRYDTQLIALQYLGMANAQMPYMGVGRNLLYRKSLWQASGGFSKHSLLASGDDDLFVQQAANANNVVSVLHRDAVTFSAACPSFSLWRNQKIRHLTTAIRYKSGLKALLIAEPLSRTMLYLALLMLVVFSSKYIAFVAVFLYLILMLLKISRFSCFAVEAGEHSLNLKIFCFDVILPLVYSYFWIIKFFCRPNIRWK